MKLDQSYGLKIAELRESEMIEDDPAKEYPALLLGNRGVEKRFGKKGLGSFFCDICVGAGYIYRCIAVQCNAG